MARPLRIEYDGAFYHIINRGLERREIYRGPKDYDYFFNLLGRINEKYGIVVHSYCLMPNHYHLYIETPQGNLAKAMRQIDGNYTQKFNKRYGRVGPLFQGRYKAMLVDKDSYSLQLCKYIHLNPVKAKIVAKPEYYLYSSYGIFIGKNKKPEFLNTSWLLSQFGKSKSRAVKALKKFTLLAEDDEWTPEKEAFKGLILGNGDFVSEIQENYLRGKVNREIPKLRRTQKFLTPEEIESGVNLFETDNSLKKKIMIYALKKYTPMSLGDIGIFVGGMTYVAISKTYTRLVESSKNNIKINRLLNKVDGFCKMSNVQT